VITNFDENLIPSKPGRGVELCIGIPETTSNENSIPGDSTFSDYSDRLLDPEPHSTADYEYIVFGGLDPDNAPRSDFRRMLQLNVLAALRDAEKDVANWRRSPLRPLIEALDGHFGEADRDAIQTAVDEAQTVLTARPEVDALAQTISERLQAESIRSMLIFTCWTCGYVGNALALSTYPQADACDGFGSLQFFECQIKSCLVNSRTPKHIKMLLDDVRIGLARWLGGLWRLRSRLAQTVLDISTLRWLVVDRRTACFDCPQRVAGRAKE
jgi:hypothetical protein